MSDDNGNGLQDIGVDEKDSDIKPAICGRMRIWRDG